MSAVSNLWLVLFMTWDRDNASPKAPSDIATILFPDLLTLRPFLYIVSTREVAHDELKTTQHEIENNVSHRSRLGGNNGTKADGICLGRS